MDKRWRLGIRDGLYFGTGFAVAQALAELLAAIVKEVFAMGGVLADLL